MTTNNMIGAQESNPTSSAQKPIDSPDTTSEKSYSRWFSTSILCVAISLGVAGFFVYQNIQLKKQVATLTGEVKPPLEKDEIIINGIENWKKFILPTLGVSITLPPELISKANVIADEEIIDLSSIDSFYKGKILTSLKIVSGTGSSRIEYFDIVSRTNEIYIENDAYNLHFNHFYQKDGSYFINDHLLPVHPENKLITDNILRIVQTVTHPQAQGLHPKDPLDYVIAIVNLDDDSEFPGFTVRMRLDNNLALEVFDQILSSINIE